MPQLLVVDDDPEVRNLVEAYALNAGWQVATAADAAAGLTRFHEAHPDIVVLDLMLPDRSGWDVLAQIRQESQVYVVLLTARSSEAERILGLTKGADDYLVKPFSPGELMARCQALLRRPRGKADVGTQTAKLQSEHGLLIDLDQYRVELDGRPVDLTALEFNLLKALARHPGRVFTRGQLVETLWGADYEGYDRVIDVHIGHLRKKLGDDSLAPRFIETVRSVGYRFLPDVTNG